MRTVTALELANYVLQARHHKTLSSISASQLLDQQLLTALNWSNGIIFSRGSCYWQEYMGTFITVTGKRTYEVTPETTNYCPTSRVFTAATLNNVTMTSFSAVSWDDSFKLSKATATGASPSVTVTSIATVNSGRVTASIWLAGDATDVPGTGDETNTVTLTLTDTVGGQSVTKDVTVGETPDRYAISGAFSSAQATVKLKVSWASPTGIVYLDACQIEKYDYATEYIDNTSAVAAQIRTAFAAPDRLLGVGKYKPGTTPVEQDIYLYDPGLYPYERANRLIPNIDPRFSNQGGMISVEGVDADAHVIYRAKEVPMKLTAGTDTLTIPEPWIWVLVEGGKAFMDNAMYDIGANKDAQKTREWFETQVDSMLALSEPSPAYTYLPNNYPRMY